MGGVTQTDHAHSYLAQWCCSGSDLVCGWMHYCVRSEDQRAAYACGYACGNPCGDARCDSGGYSRGDRDGHPRDAFAPSLQAPSYGHSSHFVSQPSGDRKQPTAVDLSSSSCLGRDKVQLQPSAWAASSGPVSHGAELGRHEL